MTDQRTLRQLQDDTRKALAELVDPIRRGQWRDDGTVSQHTAPSLLDQLREEVGNSSNRGARRKSTPIPISADAVDLLNTIGAGTIYLVAQADAVPEGISIEAGLRAVVAKAGQWTELEPIAGVKYALTGWVKAIRLLLDPPRRLHIAKPCPRCNRLMVWRRDEAIGEDVQQHVLSIDPATGCDCLHCGAHWPPEQFEFLASLLGCPPLPGADDGGGSAA